MEVKIYGRDGCKKCSKLKEKVDKIVEEREFDDIQVKKVNDIEELVEKGVMSTPALSVDGEVVIAGDFPSTDKILEELK